MKGKEVGWLMGWLMEGRGPESWVPAFIGVELEGMSGPSTDSGGSDWTGRTSTPGME